MPPVSHLRSLLADCRNPWRADTNGTEGMWSELQPLSAIGFVRFGGAPWREGTLGRRYVNHVALQTARVLGGVSLDGLDCHRCHCCEDAPEASREAASQQATAEAIMLVGTFVGSVALAVALWGFWYVSRQQQQQQQQRQNSPQKPKR